jgi:hypothetical protein
MFDEMITVFNQTHKWKFPDLYELQATLLCVLVYSNDASVLHAKTICIVGERNKLMLKSVVSNLLCLLNLTISVRSFKSDFVLTVRSFSATSL